MIKYTGINHKKVSAYVGTNLIYKRITSRGRYTFYLQQPDQPRWEEPNYTKLEKGKFYGRKGKHIEVSDSAPIK